MLINIYELCNDNSDDFELAVIGNFYLIFYNLYENFKNHQNSKTIHYNKDLEALHNMVGYIQKNYHSKISLKEIATSGNVCRSNCCEIFQSILSKSPITYLTDYRLEKALQLLDNTSLPSPPLYFNVDLIAPVTLQKLFTKNLVVLHPNIKRNI